MKKIILKALRAVTSAALALSIAAGAAGFTDGGLFTNDTASVAEAADNPTLHYNVDVALYIRQQLVNNATSIRFTLDYMFDSNEQAFDQLGLLFDYMAKGYTGNADEGDILFTRQYTNTSITTNGYSTQVEFTVQKDMTNSQQKAANEAAARIEKQLNLTGLKSDYDRIKAVHDYLVTNVKYDYSFQKHSLYDALVNKKCVCDGFAKAMYKMLNDVGIPCRIMIGTGEGDNHAWNTVYLEGKWYFIDVTWDANYYETSKGVIPYKWFLTCWNHFYSHAMNEYSQKYWSSIYCDYAASDFTKTSGSSAGFNYEIMTESGFRSDISKCTASLSYSSYGYDGNAKRPTVTVKDGSRKLTNGKDYTVEYKNNVKSGTATAVITGKGNYAGTLKKTYHIGEAFASISIPYASYTYSGSAIKPVVTVKNSAGQKLTLGTDYTVSYSNNVKVGIAKITIVGKGRYGGTRTKTFVVKPAKNAITSITTTKGAFRLKWTKATPGAVGYQVLYSTDKDFAKNVHSYTSTDLSDLTENFSRVPNSGEIWYVKVRSFYTKDGLATSTRYGNYSAVRSVKVL
ncbi:MAG: hypothetical protein IKN17_12890 [Ruminococcus sp.]|nr:hypothetical protein [Ruminococcus sp.]